MMDGAISGATITLESDYTEAVTVPEGKDLIIDLGGHMWTAADGSTPFTVYDSTVVIRNGTISAMNQPCIRVSIKNGEKQTKVILESNLTLKDSGHSCVFIARHGTLDTSADMISTNSAHCIAGNGSEPYFDNTCIVRGGTLITTDDAKHKSVAIYWPQRGYLNIMGGTITGDTGVEVRGGSVTVTGGSIKATAPFSITGNGNGSTTTGAALAICQHITRLPITCVISGGIFAGDRAFIEANPQNNSAEAVSMIDLLVTGGNFQGLVESEDCTAFIEGGTFQTGAVAGTLLKSGLQYTYNGDTITYYSEPSTDSAMFLTDMIVDGAISSTKQGRMVGTVETLPEDAVVGTLVYHIGTKKLYKWDGRAWEPEDMDIADDALMEDSERPIQTQVVYEMKEQLQNQLDERYTKSETQILLDGKQPMITGAAQSIVTDKLAREYILKSDSAGNVAVSDIAVSVLESLSGLDADSFQQRGLIFTDKALTSWSPFEDTSGQGFSYRGLIQLDGVSENDIATVILARADAVSGKYAPDCDTVVGGVMLYSKVNTAISVPLIYITKG